MPCNQKGDALYGSHLYRLDVRHTTFGSFSKSTVYLDGIPPTGTSVFGCKPPSMGGFGGVTNPKKNDTSCRGGERCSFVNLSASCHRCEDNQKSSQGLECAACPSGRAPDVGRVQCVPCTPGMAGSDGVCNKCAKGCAENAKIVDRVVSGKRTGCRECVRIWVEERRDRMKGERG